MSDSGEWLGPASPEARRFHRALDEYRLGHKENAIRIMTSIHGVSPEGVAVTLANIAVQHAGLTDEGLHQNGGLLVAIAGERLPTDEEASGIAAAGLLVVALTMDGAPGCIEAFRQLPDDTTRYRALTSLMAMAATALDEDDARDN